MADPKGFLTTPRLTPARRPVSVRIADWREVYTDFGTARLELQAGRCMDCGIPFCHQGCPLGNLIPEWNDLVRREDWAVEKFVKVMPTDYRRVLEEQKKQQTALEPVVEAVVGEQGV